MNKLEKEKKELIEELDLNLGKIYSHNKEFNKLHKEFLKYEKEYIKNKITKYGYSLDSISSNSTELLEIENRIGDKSNSFNSNNNNSKKDSIFNGLKIDIKDKYPKEKKCKRCKKELEEIKVESSYKIFVTNSKLKLIKLNNHIYRCSSCYHIHKDYYLPLEEKIFPKSILSISFGSYLIECKYFLGISIKEITNKINKELNTSFLESYIKELYKELAKKLEPIYKEMVNSLIDDSSINVLELKNFSSKTLANENINDFNHLYLFSSSYYQPSLYIYAFYNKRIDNLKVINNLLKGFKGYLLLDGSSFELEEYLNKYISVKIAKSWDYPKNLFIKALNLNAKEENDDSSLANKFLALINELIEIEEKFLFKAMGPIKKGFKRKRRSKEILQEINNLVDEVNLNPSLVKEDALTKEAIEFIKINFNELSIFIDDGEIEPLNSIYDNAISPSSIGLSNFKIEEDYLSFKSSLILFSITKTADLNMLDLNAYLKFVFENISKYPPIKLIPNNYSMTSVFRNYYE